MSKKPKKAGAFLSLCNSVENIARRFLDTNDLNRSRLRNIENRLAAIDGGDDANRAIDCAYDAANSARHAAGQPALQIERPKHQ